LGLAPRAQPVHSRPSKAPSLAEHADFSPPDLRAEIEAGTAVVLALYDGPLTSRSHAKVRTSIAVRVSEGWAEAAVSSEWVRPARYRSDVPALLRRWGRKVGDLPIQGYRGQIRAENRLSEL